jgi:hypothetical protein
MHAAGIKVGGVELIDPEHGFFTNAFIPIDDIIKYNAV